MYGGIMQFRNYLYDRDLRKSFHFDSCVISVGNLSVGGSGKTPMTEYLIRMFSKKYEVSTLSRGYGRKTRGFRMARENDSAGTIGDEPFQYFTKFSDIHVAVGERRALAIPFILAEEPGTDIILMDDAYQHRSVLPDFQILVTEFSRPFYNDHVMPSGRLREKRKGARRADAIVITKCPDELDVSIQAQMRKETGRYAPGVPLYFTAINYGLPVAASGVFKKNQPLVMVTGIADPAPLASHLQKQYEVREHLQFPDHHSFSKSDIEKISKRLGSNNAALVTTEKDLMRLRESGIWEELNSFTILYVPIEVRFLHDRDKFDAELLKVAESRCS